MRAKKEYDTRRNKQARVWENKKTIDTQEPGAAAGMRERRKP